MRVSPRVLGWYHIFGASGGLLLMLWAWRVGGLRAAYSFSAGAVPFALAWAAGIALLRGEPRARQLAYVTQALQIPILVAPAAAWKFQAGLVGAIVTTLDGPRLAGGIEATWVVGAGQTAVFPAVIGLNLVPVAVMVLIARARPVPRATPVDAAPADAAPADPAPADPAPTDVA